MPRIMYENEVIEKKKKILLILTAVLVLLTVAYLVLDLYTVENVSVEGNVHYTASGIRDIVERGWFADNTLMLSLKYKDKSIKDIPFIETIDVNVVSRNAVKINVREKEIAGYVRYMDRFMYFDKDGVVVEASGVETEGLPLVTGLQFDSFKMYAALPVNNEHVFQTVLNMTQAIDAAGLKAEEIAFDKDYDISFVTGDVRVSIGDDKNMNEKVQMAAKLLSSEEMTGRKGTLHIENYQEGKELYYFKND